MSLRSAILAGFTALMTATSCMNETTSPKEPEWMVQAIGNARKQIGLEIDTIENSGKILNPVTLNTNGQVYYCGYADWRSGFFPGSIWYLYELTGDTTLLPLAQKYTEAISEAQYLTWHHDIGFIINCSFGNGLRLSPKSEYKNVMIQAAQSLSTRFRTNPQVIQSWDVKGNSWQSKRGWECPVIIDNMMNLELLFEATRLSGDSIYYQIAVAHADRTLKEHFRPDGSCYHVVDYSIKNGNVRHRQTAQGYADESAWARGQAWAIYGYTMCYRETQDIKYLNQAVKTFNFMKKHKNTLYELSTYPVENPQSFKDYADSIMVSLSSPTYTAEIGENGRFVLMHSVGSIPHGSEIDVPLNYADYYYLEALKRKRDLEKEI